MTDRSTDCARAGHAWAPWVFVLSAALLLGLVLVFAERWLEAGPRPPFDQMSRGGKGSQPPRPAQATPGLLRLAGSGSNLPVTRKLAQAFMRARPGSRVIVHQSIGSSGGVRATWDGAVDLGLVSRPLSADERQLGLAVIPYARVAIVVAVNAMVPDEDISAASLLDIYRGARRTFKSGMELTVLLREQGDSSHLSFSRVIPGFGAAHEAALGAGRWRVSFTDGALLEELMATPSGLGLSDLGAIVSQDLPVKVLRMDGVAPSDQTVLSGHYPFFKDLSFVSSRAPTRLAAELVRFVLSAEGRQVISSNGYLPLDGAPR